VTDIDEATTDKLCLQGSRYWFQTETVRTTQLNGISFKVFEIADNWAGGGQWGPVYRTFRDNKCYELGIQTVMGGDGYDAETLKKFTNEDSAKVQLRLKQALNSFTFLK